MTIYLSNLHFHSSLFNYSFVFESDLEDMETYESHDNYCNVSFNADNGRTAPGSVYADTYPKPGGPLRRLAGVKYTPLFPIWVSENDVLSGWGYNITEVRAGVGFQQSGIEAQIHYVGGASTTANTDVEVGNWGQATLTVPSGDIGEVVDYIIIAMYSNSESTAEFYIDDIIFKNEGDMIAHCDVQFGALPTGDPIYHCGVRTG